jgi:hypothetical protein
MAKRKSAKKAKAQGICAYCGRIDQLSEDHVIPRCFFSGNLPGDIPKVYACSFCNNTVKSSNDTYLRDALIMDMDSSQHPLARQLWDKFARAVSRNQSVLANEVVQHSQLVPLSTPSGLFAGWAYGFEPAQRRNTAILSMMVRGLYQFYIGRRLPSQTQFDVFRMRGDPEQLATHVRALLQLGARLVRVGDGQVFESIYGYVPNRPEVSLWLLFFFQSAIFGVATDKQMALQTSSA